MPTRNRARKTIEYDERIEARRAQARDVARWQRKYTDLLGGAPGSPNRARAARVVARIVRLVHDPRATERLVRLLDAAIRERKP
jgi:hypothetical protein